MGTYGSKVQMRLPHRHHKPASMEIQQHLLLLSLLPFTTLKFLPNPQQPSRINLPSLPPMRRQFCYLRRQTLRFTPCVIGNICRWEDGFELAGCETGEGGFSECVFEEGF